jgi:hypothetical protein
MVIHNNSHNIFFSRQSNVLSAERVIDKKAIIIRLSVRGKINIFSLLFLLMEKGMLVQEIFYWGKMLSVNSS